MDSHETSELTVVLTVIIEEGITFFCSGARIIAQLAAPQIKLTALNRDDTDICLDVVDAMLGDKTGIDFAADG